MSDVDTKQNTNYKRRENEADPNRLRKGFRCTHMTLVSSVKSGDDN